MGPKNSMPRHSKPKPKGKTPEELLKKLRWPSRRGLQEYRAAIALPDGGRGKSGLESLSAGSAIDKSFQASFSHGGYCKARLWADGLLTQCKAKTGDVDFCRRHVDEQSHGRIDEDVPAEVAAKARKYLSKRSQTQLGSSQNSEQSAQKKKRQIVITDFLTLAGGGRGGRRMRTQIL